MFLEIRLKTFLENRKFNLLAWDLINKEVTADNLTSDTFLNEEGIQDIRENDRSFESFAAGCRNKV